MISKRTNYIYDVIDRTNKTLMELGPERTTDYDLMQKASRMGIPLKGVFSKNELPKKALKGGYVINLQDSDDGNGTHWSCIYIKPKEAIYFDSFGFAPPFEVIDFCPTGKLRYNDVQIQDIDEAYCGDWCILFLYYMSTKPNNIGGAKTLEQRYKAFMKQFKSLNK